VRLTVLWDFPAEAVRIQLGLKTQMAICREVIRFAETREGNVRQDGPYYRLRVAGFEAMLSIDRDAETLSVLRLYTARR
jgi:hypothetical protein